MPRVAEIKTQIFLTLKLLLRHRRFSLRSSEEKRGQRAGQKGSWKQRAKAFYFTECVRTHGDAWLTSYRYHYLAQVTAKLVIICSIGLLTSQPFNASSSCAKRLIICFQLQAWNHPEEFHLGRKRTAGCQGSDRNGPKPGGLILGQSSTFYVFELEIHCTTSQLISPSA